MEKRLRFAKKYAGKRGGFSIWAILAVIAVAAVLATLIVPRLGNTDLPAIEANLKEDVKNIKGAMEQGSLSTPNKNFTGVDLAMLKTNNVIKGGFADSIDGATKIYTANYGNNIKVSSQGNNADNNESMVMMVDFSAMTPTEKKTALGTSMYAWLSKFAGSAHVGCAAGQYATGTIDNTTCTTAAQQAGVFVVGF